MDFLDNSSAENLDFGRVVVEEVDGLREDVLYLMSEFVFVLS